MGAPAMLAMCAAVAASVEVKFQARSIKENKEDSMLIKGLVNQ